MQVICDLIQGTISDEIIDSVNDTNMIRICNRSLAALISIFRVICDNKLRSDVNIGTFFNRLLLR